MARAAEPPDGLVGVRAGARPRDRVRSDAPRDAPPAQVPDGETRASLVDRLENWTRPFSADVWLALFVLVVLAGAAYALLIRDEAAGTPGDDLYTGVYMAGVTMTGAGGFAPTSRAGKAFVLVFSFFALLVVAAYTAGLRRPPGAALPPHSRAIRRRTYAARRQM